MMSIRNILFTLLAMFAVADPALALDPPHDSSNSIECLNCHNLHNSLGDALTSVAGNANLCQSCHVTGGTATGKPFADADQARPGLALPAGMAAGGTSHRWDAGPQGRVEADSANTSTGTVVSGGAYTGHTIQTYTILITTAGDTGTAQFEWYLQIGGSGVADGSGTTGTNVALGDGLTLSFTDGTSPSFAAGDTWYLYVVADLATPTDPEMLARLEGDGVMCSTCHNQHSQSKTPFDPLAPAYGGPGTGEGRHDQRIDNNTEQMCKDCHGARDVSVSSQGSHPVGVIVPTTGDYQAPSGLPLDAANKVSCLTCHDMHFNGASNGQLLRINNIQTMCTECHTLASGAASHFSTSAAEMWPGGQYGSSYPALSDAGKVASCANCHYPHGWPDDASPATDYSLLAVDFEESQCYTCHDGNPASSDIRTDIQKASGHPLAANSGVHDSAETAVVNSATRHVECNDCHNPHEAESRVSVPGASTSPRLASSGPMTGVQGVNTAGNPVATATYEYEVCFRCHADSTGKPAAPTPRLYPETNVRTEFTAKTSYHPVTKVGATTANGDMPSLINGWAANSITSCTNCHNSNSGPAAGGAGPNGAHGSTWPTLLEKRFDTNDPSTYAQAKYASCFSCHSASNILSDDNKSFKEHKKHIQGEDASCNLCHDPHASSNDRLINFDTSVVTPSGGKIEFIWGGAGSGSCQLVCHGKNHKPKTY